MMPLEFRDVVMRKRAMSIRARRIARLPGDDLDGEYDGAKVYKVANGCMRSALTLTVGCFDRTEALVIWMTRVECWVWEWT